MNRYRTPRRTIDQWKQLIAEFEAGDVDIQQFCKHHDINRPYFTKLRRKLSTDSDASNKPQAGFVELKSKPEPQSSPFAFSLKIQEHYYLQWNGLVDPDYIARLSEALV